MPDFRGAPWVYDGTLTVYQMDEGTPNVCVVADDDCAEANAFLIAAAPQLYAMLARAAAIFREYEKLHLAKGTPEGDVKALRNGCEAIVFEQLLATARGEDAEPETGSSHDRADIGTKGS